jgi:aspartyl-tRNA synthetase
MAMAEDLISQCWRATVQPDLPFDRFPVMKFNDVYNAYGTDKPDIRFDMKVCLALIYLLPNLLTK